MEFVADGIDGFVEPKVQNQIPGPVSGPVLPVIGHLLSPARERLQLEPFLVRLACSPISASVLRFQIVQLSRLPSCG